MFRSLSSLSLSTPVIRNSSMAAASVLRAHQPGATFSLSISSSLQQEPASGSDKKDPAPSQSGKDESGTDAVAATDAAFEPGLSSEDAAKKIEKETGDSLQTSPVNPKASKPKGPQQGVSDATDGAKK